MSSESWHPINIQQLRQSLKMKWLTYYKTNRRWLARMQVWGTFNGHRRPYSGFILATITALEPKLHHILPFVLDLNNNPDDIIAALGLNFNPEEQLHLVKLDDSSSTTPVNTTTTKPIDNQTFYKPSVSKPTETSKALTPVTPIVDSLKQQSDPPQSDKRTIDVKVTTPNDELKEDRQNLQNVRVQDMRVHNVRARQSLPQKPSQSSPQRPLQSSPPLQSSKQQSFPQQSFPQKPLPKPETKLQNLPADTHQSVPVTTKVEIKDTRGEALAKKIDVKQPAKVETLASSTSTNNTSTSNTFSSQEKNTSKADSIGDTKNQVEQQPARVNRLAKWIDELCQGSSWDRDDMVFIRF